MRWVDRTGAAADPSAGSALPMQRLYGIYMTAIASAGYSR